MASHVLELAAKVYGMPAFCRSLELAMQLRASGDILCTCFALQGGALIIQCTDLVFPFFPPFEAPFCPSLYSGSWQCTSHVLSASWQHHVGDGLHEAK